MERTGVYCYDYIDNISCLDETVLSQRERFYNRLTDRQCSEEDYAYAQRVWRGLDRTLEDYMWHYLLADVCLLYVFDNFRRICFGKYNLDQAYLMISPLLS